VPKGIHPTAEHFRCQQKVPQGGNLFADRPNTPFITIRGANIAEAWRKRRYEAHFISKLTDADAENTETQHWLDTAFACEYLSKPDHATLSDASAEVGRLIGSMISTAPRWCAVASAQ